MGAVAKNFYILNAVLEEESQSSTKPIDTGIITSSGPSIRQRVQLVCESNKHLAAARAGARELRLPGRSLTEFPDFVCTLSNVRRICPFCCVLLMTTMSSLRCWT